MEGGSKVRHTVDAEEVEIENPVMLEWMLIIYLGNVPPKS
jgi:hypothetical protein